MGAGERDQSGVLEASKKSPQPIEEGVPTDAPRPPDGMSVRWAGDDGGEVLVGRMCITRVLTKEAESAGCGRGGGEEREG